MRIADSREVLLTMLAEAGITPGPIGSGQLPSLLDAMQRFAAVTCDDTAPPDEDGDGLLAQYGTTTWRGRREFTTDLTRQLIEAADDDAPMWQLSCTVHWTPTPETDALQAGHIWSFGTPPETFFDAVRALPGWTWALAAPDEQGDLTIILNRV